MLEISFPPNTLIASEIFAIKHLNNNLSNKKIESLNLTDKEIIDKNLRKIATSEYNLYVKHAILITCITLPLFTTLFSIPFTAVAITLALKTSSIFSITLLISATAISAISFKTIYEKYNDFKMSYINIHKYNSDALIHIAKTIKKPSIPPIILPTADKENIFELLKELETSFIPNVTKLTTLGKTIADSALTNNTFAEMLAFIFSDEKTLAKTEKILCSTVKKTFITLGLSTALSNNDTLEKITEILPKFAKLTGQDATQIKQLVETRNWDGFFNLFI